MKIFSINNVADVQKGIWSCKILNKNSRKIAKISHMCRNSQILKLDMNVKINPRVKVERSFLIDLSKFYSNLNAKNLFLNATRGNGFKFCTVIFPAPVIPASVTFLCSFYSS